MSEDDAPRVVILSGPNGAGKSSAAELVVRGTLGIRVYVNADVIAQGLSGWGDAAVEIRAGRIMLERLDELAANRADFAFETTLSSRSLAVRIGRWKAAGYRVGLVYLWLPSAATAVERVGKRVTEGGHSVPDEVIRRRYHRGLCNFLNLYRDICDEWEVLWSPRRRSYRLVAKGNAVDGETIYDEPRWAAITAEDCNDHDRG